MTPNLTDELQCFRRAAELGCPDFESGVDLNFVGILGATYALPCKLPRANRYAAAVCADWWFTRDLDDDGLANEDFMIMAKQARNFGRKYGEAK